MGFLPCCPTGKRTVADNSDGGAKKKTKKADGEVDDKEAMRVKSENEGDADDESANDEAA